MALQVCLACRGAGTTGKVFVELVGSEASTKQLALDNSWDNFTRGSVDKFLLQCRPLGEVIKLRVALMPAESGGEKVGMWHLDAVHVVKKEVSHDEPLGSFNHQDWVYPGQV
jgi:PLAT/LH2 domain